MSATDAATAPTTNTSKSTSFRPINRTNPHVVILGGGFGGLQFARSLSGTSARVTLVDKQNHHLFQPLLYQVATGSLSPEDIAQPIRGLLSGHPNVSVVQGEVTGIDLKSRAVAIAELTLEYDYLVIAMGGSTTYFGKDHWEKDAPGMKTLNDALRIRREILLGFEKAELATDDVERKKMMTIVIVGAGPTGVELAGACRELGKHVLHNNFRKIKPEDVRVVLLDALPAVLGPFKSKYISDSAVRQLQQLGVEIRLNSMVSNVEANKVSLKDGTVFECSCIVWSAGVGANPITKTLGVETDRAGRIKVNPDCSIPSFPEAFAIGDVANLTQPDGSFVPWVSPGAIQMGQHVAKIIHAEVHDPKLSFDKRPKFSYWDKGSMAIIGRYRAVFKMGPLILPVMGLLGSLAWLMWLTLHLLFLEGFSTKIVVACKWIWGYLTNTQYTRVAVLPPPPPPAQPAPKPNP